MHEECSMGRDYMRVTGKTCVFGHTLYPHMDVKGIATGNVCEKMRRSYDTHPGLGDRYNTNIDGYIYTYIILEYSAKYSAKVTILISKVFCANLSISDGEYLSV